ncbi:hypothetical protein KGQ20_08775 [Catenulispora sp. NF23]|uniref:Uncharacterized protein n=1 Tax=Catenulispora pinistramenti TaxID=2705254 RepID=A0ABS5KJY1_9ACTN|nr:hypothetical protein [Catenulispora pinistramenti]MBS2532866.1 hypothetical protein [Catenulispora pinistramenti]MBS2546320.1 hypothetical protein [Catenulispora pinistramenti]
MNAVDASAGEDAMRGLIGTAFAAGEPGLPDVDDVIATVEVLGGRIRHRQRVRTGLAAGALCVAGFGMVAGIAAVAHSSGTVVLPGGGGSGGQPPPAASVSTGSGGVDSSGTSAGTTSVDP